MDRKEAQLDVPWVPRTPVRAGKMKTSYPPTEVKGKLPTYIDLTGELMPESAKTSHGKTCFMFYKGARIEISADGESGESASMWKDMVLEMQERDVGLTYDINSSTKQAATNKYTSVVKKTNIYTSFPDEQTPSTPPRAKPKVTLTGKQKYVRTKQLNKFTPQKQMTRVLTEAIVPESKETSRRKSSNSDIESKLESSACRESSDVQIDNVVEETPVGLVYNRDSWMKQVLNCYRSLPEGTQAPSTYPSNKTSTPTETTGELAEPIMSDTFTTIPCGSSLNFDKGGRDGSNLWGESPACDKNILVKEALYNYTSLSENKQAPSRSLPKSNPHGAKQNANTLENTNKRKGLATAQDGTIKCAVNSNMNLIGAQHNGLSSYQPNFLIEFPNIHKKRRTGKRTPNLIGAHHNGFSLYQPIFLIQFPNIQKKKGEVERGNRI